MLQRNADAEGSKIEMTEESLEEFESVRAVEEFEAKERARKNAECEKEVTEYQRRTAINALQKEGEWFDEDMGDIIDMVEPKHSIQTSTNTTNDTQNGTKSTKMKIIRNAE